MSPYWEFSAVACRKQGPDHPQPGESLIGMEHMGSSRNGITTPLQSRFQLATASPFTPSLGNNTRPLDRFSSNWMVLIKLVVPICVNIDDMQLETLLSSGPRLKWRNIKYSDSSALEKQPPEDV